MTFVNISDRVFDPTWRFRVRLVSLIGRDEWVVTLQPEEGNPLPVQRHSFIRGQAPDLGGPNAPRIVAA